MMKNGSHGKNPYEHIGVRSFINCCGTRTIHGGSLMWPEVKNVMMAAANHFVNIDELMEGVGRRLSELTGAEWGIVTSGAAASLYCATAACVAGTDPEKMLRLPDTAGLRNRVIMQKGGRFTYDHAIRMVGVDIVEIETRAELARAIDDRVAMVALLGAFEVNASLRLEEILTVTKPAGIPVLVDAAAEHLLRPVPYLERGATMVAYSGGKLLRGPQTSGLLLGEKSWIKAAWVNAAPHHTLGRPMKAGKEEIMGLLAAVEYWAAERDHVTEANQWKIDLEAIATEVDSLSVVSTDIQNPEDPVRPVPQLEIRWDGSQIGLTGSELRDRLLAGDPRIMLDDRLATETSVSILPFSLQAGEAKIVGSKVREVLSTAPGPRTKEYIEPANLEGSWEMKIQFYTGQATHRVFFEQTGSELTGRHQTRFFENTLSGNVRGNIVTFQSLHKYEGTHISYQFTGTIKDNTITGTVALGQCSQTALGPLNQSEYGSGRWKARQT